VGPTLVFHFGALGDFVLSWPALGLLAGGPPPSDLHLVGNPIWGRLILDPQRVHDRESRRLAPLFLGDSLGSGLQEWLEGFARAVVFHRSPDPTLLAHLRLAGIKQVWSLPTRPPAGQRLHVGDNQVLHLRARGLSGPAQPLPCRLPPPPQPGPPILAPGSGGRAKRLAPPLAARLARILARAGMPPLLLLGPAEDQAYRAELEESLAGVGHAVLAEPSTPELVAALQAAPFYVGADSGVSHLAAALGAPTLAVFSASDPLVWSPRGARVEVCAPGEAPSRLEGLLGPVPGLPITGRAR
jgi:hypothetical protein